MFDRRHFHTVFALVGPASDRDGTKLYFEQAGYLAAVFKNPEVFFDELKTAKNPIVVLETFALKSKLSEWVQKLASVNPRLTWIVVAPISQYSIISSIKIVDWLILFKMISLTCWKDFFGRLIDKRKKKRFR